MIYYSLYLIVRRLRKKRYLQAFIHIFVAIILFSTIFMMIKKRYPKRWHHMTIGSIFTFFGLISLNTLGIMLIIDSIWCWIEKNDDIFVDHLKVIIIIYVTCTIYEIIKKIDEYFNILINHEIDNELNNIEENIIN